ncbi:TraB/GumN family protein [Massilia sp. TWP1-3-3]|uniref:TraB/GumN family protein n=1 Tax=Massilia sp. TWP1-3-3 TaxID=2804573 RepID=UPI003CF2FAFD
MRRQIIVVFFSLLCLALPPTWGADRGALFKVTAYNHTMYLFGTMHVGTPEFYPLEPRIADAVKGASTLALEIDPGLDPAIAAHALKTYGMTSPGATRQALAPAMRARLDRALAKAHIDPEAVVPLKPWLVATVLAMAEYARQGYRTDLSVDAHLAQLARASKVPVVGLESAGSQMSLFNRLTMAEQVGFLEESIGLIESGKQGVEVSKIVNAWRTADQGAFDEIAARASRDTSVSGKFVKHILLEERNNALAEKLAQLLEREASTVAAIGVLHLIGENSVPSLLGERGMSVERVY